MNDDSIKTEIEEKSMQCNVEDHTGGEDDEEVEILEISNDKNEIEVSECNDDTDVCSSSFSGTLSEHDETEETGFNDQEADSIMCTDAASLPFWVRKKKLTDHWRRFIQPITWRCKWVELKIRELQNQARRYEKELQESCQAKQLELENLKSEEVGVKALSPLPCHTQKTRVKKRRKRKRVEEAASDVPSYALNHSLFSYHENRKSFADVGFNDNSRTLDKKNKNSKEEAVFCEETSPLELREGDEYLEEILLKIEAAKVEARNLKNRVDKLVNENPTRFSLEQQKPLLVISPVKSASVSLSEDDESTDILLSEMMASIQREGKAKKLQKTEHTSVEEGPSRPVRTRKPRKLDVEVKEETQRKKRRVTKEKPKSNVTVPCRPKRPSRQRKRGKRRSGSTASRRRS